MGGECVIAGLTEITVQSTEEALAVVEKGRQSRVVGHTDMNEHSSRSHCLVRLIVTTTHEDGSIAKAKVYLIDLAG